MVVEMSYILLEVAVVVIAGEDEVLASAAFDFATTGWIQADY